MHENLKDLTSHISFNIINRENIHNTHNLSITSPTNIQFNAQLLNINNETIYRRYFSRPQISLIYQLNINTLN